MSFPWNLILCLLLIYLLIVLSMYAGKWVSRLIDRKRGSGRHLLRNSAFSGLLFFAKRCIIEGYEIRKG